MEEKVQDITVEVGLRKPEALTTDDLARLRDGEYVVKGGRGTGPTYTKAQRRRVAKGQPVGPLTAGQKRKILALRKKAGPQAAPMSRREREQLGLRKPRTRGKRG